MKQQLATIEPGRIELSLGTSLALVVDSRQATRDAARQAAWAMLRGLLGTLISCPPGELRFVKSPRGKPAVERAGAPSFNLSHSRGLSLIALSWSGDIGCDIENRFTEDDVLGLGESILHPSELEPLRQMAPAERRDAFRRYWVRKEAVLKAAGSGFLRDPRLVVTGLEARHPTWIGDEGPALVIHDGLVTVDCAASVASLDAHCRWHLLAG